jgi:four helix bundle protein
MQSEASDLRQRTKEFALQIVWMFSGLPKTTEAHVLGKQVLRSGTSVGANYREAYRAPANLSLSRDVAIHCVSWRRLPTGSNFWSRER